MLFKLLTTSLFGLAVQGAVPSRTSAQAKTALIKALLTPQLSENATIVFPDSERWEGVTHRAAAPRVNPGYLAVVNVASEDDVVNTIRMRGLNQVALGPNNDTACAGGGIIQYELLQALDRSGKQAVHGLCECVSIMGPLLGGGHSVLQGVHGFAADNLVSAKVVLHDGTVVTASETENEDLFWGLRGAGHNLGIVVEFEVKAYDIHPDPWTFMTFVYEADKIEEYFEAWNRLEDTIADPGLLVLNGYYRNLPDQNWAGYVNSIAHWDPASMRASYTLFVELVAMEAYNTSTFIFESYGRKGVREIPDAFNAVSPEDRNRHNMMATFIFWSDADETDLAVARDFGKRLQLASRNGETAHSYVNYAIGGEELPQVYGRDAGRLAKLQAIKAKYDPYNRFGFYASLAAA
ncbi:hypothetical protein BDW74DRAFT_189252 [Aspergillus multicolor]|uniref:FAD-binding oxidoreductase n=1 Tax=Aspergillus multicolor TaxID=41759 RepID=UPI003CCD98B7